MEVGLQMVNVIGHGKHSENGNCMRKAATVHGCVYAPDSAAQDYEDFDKQYVCMICIYIYIHMQDQIV